MATIKTVNATIFILKQYSWFYEMATCFHSSLVIISIHEGKKRHHPLLADDAS
jgi:hypothetical protein